MMRALVRSAALACVLAAASPAVAAASPVDVTPTEGTPFPDRAYVLTLPRPMHLAAGAVVVRENGEVVPDVTLTPAALAREGQFATVLAIDASRSMRGAAIDAAMTAARAFAAERGGAEQLGVVAFNSETATLVPLSADAAAIDAALGDAPPLEIGTHMYDGIAAALAMLARAKIASGSVVVLSDGADTGSRATLAQVAQTAADDHVRLFTVGLRSHAFDPTVLRRLAEAGGGSYWEAARTAQLEAIFAELGAQLSNQYVLRYRSAASPETTIHVDVAVAGVDGHGVAAYRTPVLEPDAGVFHRAFGIDFWRSPTAMGAIALLGALLAGLVTVLLLRPRERTLRRRMGEWVSIRSLREREQPAVVTEKLYEGAERRLAGRGWWERFRLDLDVAGIEIAPGRAAVLTAAGALLLGLVAALAVGAPVLVLAGLAVPLVVRSAVSRRVRAVRARFAEQLPDNLQVLASALRAGHSLNGALAVVVDDAPEPSRKELKRAVADEQLGVSLEEALERVVVRMENADLAQVALVAALQRQTGGNTAEVLDRVSDTVRQRFELRRLVRTLTAQGRLSRWIVTALPVVLAVAIWVINPGYMDPLFQTRAGHIALAAASVLVTLGSLTIKRIVDIKL